MNSKPAVVFFLHELRRGGAEKNLCLIAAGLFKRGFSITIVTLAALPDELPYELPSSIRLKSLDASLSGRSLSQQLMLLPKLLLRLRAQMADSDSVYISFIDQLNFLLSLASLGKRRELILCERVFSGKSILRDSLLKRVSFAKVTDLLYSRARYICLQSEGSRAAFPHWLQEKLRVIPNSVPSPVPNSEKAEERRKTVLVVSRFVEQKRVDWAIRGFSALASEFPDWKLRVIGSGPKESELRALIESSGSSVEFVCASASIEDEYRSASVFVLCSSFEGFPNALAEAMSYGCAVLASDCPTGPADLIHHERDGLLFSVDDFEGFCAQLRRLLEDPDLRRGLGEAATLVSERFDLELILNRWEELLYS